MIIERVDVRNFRCILDEALDCEPLTALVGPNGSGKSTFLRALELFYSKSPRVTSEDFYNGDTSQDIEVAVTFTKLSKAASERFAPYIDKGDLTVVLVISLKEGKVTSRFYGRRLQNPHFEPIRDAPNKTEAKKLYGELRARPEYNDLPVVASADAALAALEEWETKNPACCSWQRDQGQFFGFTEVGQGYLGDFTHFIPIPAVRDAADDGTEGKGSAITEIMDLVVRSTLATNEQLNKFRDDAQKQYDEIMTTEATAKHLRGLEEGLRETLKTYVPTAGVQIQWVTEGGVSVGMPNADVKLVEDSYPSHVTRTGHGLQRAFILTMLQHLATARIASTRNVTEQTGEAGSTGVGDVGPEAGALEPGMPNLVIGIEEPELYQHPSRQRHLAKVLLQLATGSIHGVSETTQVIYATHSPLFVGIDRFDQIRLVRKAPNGDGVPKIARVASTNVDTVAEALWEACERKDKDGREVPKYTGETLKPRLQSLMTPWMSEGFFADVVVLVEGEDDRAVVLGTALAKGFDFESMGVAVIPCGGKSSMDRPGLIFKKLGIPVYLVWDGDKGGSEGPRTNRIMMGVVGDDPVDWPGGVNQKFACFETKMEDVMASELGPLFEEKLKECMIVFGYGKKDQAVKNPRLLYEVIKRANQAGAKSLSLESIVDTIVKLLAGGPDAV